MNIELDYEQAASLANQVAMTDYKALLEDGFYSGSDESLKELIEAYRVVLAYCTTEQERNTHGLLGAEMITGENTAQ